MIKEETMFVHGEDVTMKFAAYGNGLGALELHDQYGIPHMRVTTNLEGYVELPKNKTAIKDDYGSEEVIAALQTHDIIGNKYQMATVGWNTYWIFEWTPKAIRLFAERGIVL